MSMVDAAPDRLHDLIIPDDLSLLELTDEELAAQHEFRLGAIAEVFGDHPAWEMAAAWQTDHLDAALETLAKADLARDESQRLASLSGIDVPVLYDSNIVVRWPYKEELMDVEMIIFEINDHVAVRLGDSWWLHYEAPQTDDLSDLINGFWTELWGVCSALRQLSEHSEPATSEVDINTESEWTVAA